MGTIGKLIPDYIVNGNLAADITGGPINMRETNGELKLRFASTATGTPNGTLSLQGSDDTVTWDDIPGAAGQLPASGALAAQTRLCVWSGLNFEFVRLKWTAASGGTGATLNASARTR